MPAILPASLKVGKQSRREQDNRAMIEKDQAITPQYAP
jgi:hypothetical protein